MRLPFALEIRDTRDVCLMISIITNAFDERKTVCAQLIFSDGITRHYSTKFDGESNNEDK
jgi:hypothetical protein